MPARGRQFALTRTILVAERDPSGFKLKETFEIRELRRKTSSTAFYDLQGHIRASNGAKAEARMDPANGLDFGIIGVVYPVKPVAVGATWVARFDVSKAMAGPLINPKVKQGGILTVRYELKKIEKLGSRKVAVLVAKSEVKTVYEASNGDEQNPASFSETIKATSAATVRVDTADGAVIDRREETVTETSGYFSSVQRAVVSTRRIS